MEWQLALFIIFGTLILLMVSGMPVAFCFLIVNIVGALLWWGGELGLAQLSLSLVDSVTSFTLLPLPLFVLMGELMLHSGIAPNMINTMDKWLGRLPGRLSLLAVGAGSVFSTLTGASVASAAMLGDTLIPEMEKRGYSKSMSLGPILGSGGLAIMIPPSGLAVLLGALGSISIGKILMAIILPGILMAILYAVYIILRCKFQPSIAPSYVLRSSSILEKLTDSVRYILPVGLIVFLVVGLIFLGITTPSQAAATGVVGTLILAAISGKVNWSVIKKSLLGTVRISAMILLIISAAKAFSQILAFSGASQGLIDALVGLPLPPILILIGMLLVLILLGMFMSIATVMMVTVPLYMPIVHALDFNTVWFAVMFLITMEMATTSPPFGLTLFVMKGVATPDTSMKDIYQASLPFLGCDLILLALIMAFPLITLWLPAMAW